MFDRSEYTEICALTETTFWFETCAIDLHSGVSERLRGYKIYNQHSFGLGQFENIHTHNTQFSRNIRFVVRR